jgi:hypothetical protein
MTHTSKHSAVEPSPAVEAEIVGLVAREIADWRCDTLDKFSGTPSPRGVTPPDQSIAERLAAAGLLTPKLRDTGRALDPVTLEAAAKFLEERGKGKLLELCAFAGVRDQLAKEIRALSSSQVTSPDGGRGDDA